MKFVGPFIGRQYTTHVEKKIKAFNFLVLIPSLQRTVSGNFFICISSIIFINIYIYLIF
jgi:hypothetical protein